MRVRLANLAFTGCVLIGGAGLLAPGGTVSAAIRSNDGGSMNGVAGSMPAYYDHQLFTINLMQLTTAQATLLAKNSQLNTIYMSDPGLPGGQPFIAVIDAIQADGFNPLWAEVQIAFTAGHTPRQLFSDTEIAAAAASGEITLTHTNEGYRCSVIGKPAPSSGTASGTGASFGVRRTIASPVISSSSAPFQTARVSSWGGLMNMYR